MALTKQEINLLDNMNMIAQQVQLGTKINSAIVAGENGEVATAIADGDKKVKEELTKTISSGDASTLASAKEADATLKQELTQTINDKHKSILDLTKMKKHNHLAAEAPAATIVTEVNALIDDLIKCGIMNNA